MIVTAGVERLTHSIVLIHYRLFNQSATTFNTLTAFNNKNRLDGCRLYSQVKYRPAGPSLTPLTRPGELPGSIEL